MINVYYRISSESHKKDKICSKKESLRNFLSIDWGKITILMDNCNQETKDMVTSEITNYPKIETIESTLGNSQSFMQVVDFALRDLGKKELVYLVEDDYLHQVNSAEAIRSGLLHIENDKADYVTLYDHPDKYTKEYNFGEITKVIMKGGLHWKFTVSTTMTFATRVETLEQDYKCWEKSCSYNNIPRDHEAFVDLGRSNRKLITSIPGLSTHTDIKNISPGYKWKTLIS